MLNAYLHYSKTSYGDELAAALQAGASAYERLKHPLEEGESSVFFDDPGSARILYHNLASRVSSAFFSSLRTGKQTSPYSAAPLVYR